MQTATSVALPPLKDEVTATGSPSDHRMLRLADIALTDLKPSLPKQPLHLILAGPEPYPAETARPSAASFFMH